jgi:hypothetical protein
MLLARLNVVPFRFCPPTALTWDRRATGLKPASSIGLYRGAEALLFHGTRFRCWPFLRISADGPTSCRTYAREMEHLYQSP